MSAWQSAYVVICVPTLPEGPGSGKTRGRGVVEIPVQRYPKLKTGRGVLYKCLIQLVGDSGFEPLTPAV